ncbi:MAG: tRNA 2-thiouridine(34) synthase MnmA, partial [Myxococcales bacterium]|nr:tRNA 2-thiouridine(34) synthase MnmA [Myxococcales bacterium]
RIDAARRRVVVGEREALAVHEARVRDVNWVAGTPPAAPVRARVHVRYRHAGAMAKVESRPGCEARVAFDEPVTAIAPGQAAVFYDGDEVLGGGWLAAADPGRA